MHPGRSTKRTHESRAVPPVQLLATSGGLKDAPPVPPPGKKPESHTARVLNPVRVPAPRPVGGAATARAIGTRIGDPAPSTVGAIGTPTEALSGRHLGAKGDVSMVPPGTQATHAKSPHVDPSDPSAVAASARGQLPAPMGASKSGSVAPTSTRTLPPIESRRGGARRLHSHNSAEEWIDGIVARYGGLPADDPAADGASKKSTNVIHRRRNTAGSSSDDGTGGQLIPTSDGSAQPMLLIDGPGGDSIEGGPHQLVIPTEEVAVAPGAATGGGTAFVFASVSAAQTRKQLYALCQQLIVDVSKGARNQGLDGKPAPSPSAGTVGAVVEQPLIEVEVRERGQRVWHSAGCAEADLDDVEVAVEAVDEDVQAVRKRAHRAFNKTVRVYKDKIEGLKADVERWRLEAHSKDADGSVYRAVQAELDAQKTQSRQLAAKIKALMKLLERAGATIKHQEEQHEQEAAIAATGGGASALDWESVRGVVPDLIVEDREAPGILRDVVEYVETLNLRVAELEASNEVFSEKFADKDAQADMLRRERDSLAVKVRLHEASIKSLRVEAEAAQGESAGLRKELEEARKGFDQERDRLILANMEAEKAIRKTVESKPFFIAHGRGLSVPVYLRYDGKVRNLDLPKKEVEDLINLVWAARDTHNAVKRAQKAIEHREKQARGEIKDDSAAQVVVNLGSGNTIDQLIDYDNIRFVKRLIGPFAEHVAVFLVDHFGNNGGVITAPRGDSAGDDGMDMEASNRRIAAAASARGGKKGKDDKPALKLPTKQQMRKYGFSMPPGVIEFSYSLMEGCEKFKYDADIELFRRVARGEISELAYFDQMIMLVKLRSALQACARAHGSTNSATINMILDVVQKFFPTKSQESVDLLRKSLVLEIPDGNNMSEMALQSIRLSISKLFASNEHGNQGSFMEAVRDQHLEEVCVYVSEVSDTISACASLPEAKGKLVPLYVVRRRLHELDPLKPMEDINRFLLNALTVYNNEAEDEDEEDRPPRSNAIHLNSEVDCEKLAQASKRVFAKRYGAQGHDVLLAADTAGKDGADGGVADGSENTGTTAKPSGDALDAALDGAIGEQGSISAGPGSAASADLATSSSQGQPVPPAKTTNPARRSPSNSVKGQGGDAGAAAKVPPRSSTVTPQQQQKKSGSSTPGDVLSNNTSRGASSQGARAGSKPKPKNAGKQ